MKALNRRNFLAGSIAALPLLPQSDQSLGEMASALHDAIAQFPDENVPTHVQVCADGHSLNLDVDNLRSCSVEEIQDLLRPLYQGGAS